MCLFVAAGFVFPSAQGMPLLILAEIKAKKVSMSLASLLVFNDLFDLILPSSKLAQCQLSQVGERIQIDV